MDSTALWIGLGIFAFVAMRGKRAGGIAQQLAADVKSRQYNYNRALCRQFQKLAGIPQDGIYGPATRAALAKHVPNPPTALFKGAGAGPAKPKPPAAPIPQITVTPK